MNKSIKILPAILAFAFLDCNHKKEKFGIKISECRPIQEIKNHSAEFDGKLVCVYGKLDVISRESSIYDNYHNFLMVNYMWLEKPGDSLKLCQNKYGYIKGRFKKSENERVAFGRINSLSAMKCDEVEFINPKNDEIF